MPPRRWTNKLSNKRFVGKQFVVKHIRTKHADKLEEVRSKVGGGHGMACMPAGPVVGAARTLPFVAGGVLQAC